MTESNQITEAVDNLLEIHDQWAANPDPSLRTIPPREVEDAAQHLFDVSQFADVPANMRELITAIDEFRLQWDLYANGATEKDGSPKGTLWRALRKVIASRNQSSELRVKRPEPVKELLRQKVTPQQIALSIYGYDGKGPFVKDGEIQFDLINKEAENPGSVIPPEWIPPYEEARLRQHHIQVKRRIGQVDELIEKTKPHPQDPVSLLREGQFVDVIADVCNITEDEVRGIAKVMKIKPAVRTPIVRERSQFDPELREADEAMVDSMARNPAPEAIAGHPVRVSKGDREQVMELFEGGMGPQEIADKMGKGLTHKHIAQIIKKSRARA